MMMMMRMMMMIIIIIIIRMTLSRAHSSTEAADPTKLLLLNKRRIKTQALRHIGV